jgi:hypothetical protein
VPLFYFLFKTMVESSTEHKQPRNGILQWHVITVLLHHLQLAAPSTLTFYFLVVVVEVVDL